MSSRNKILNAINISQPSFAPLPDINRFNAGYANLMETYVTALTNIGGTVVEVGSINDINAFVLQTRRNNIRMVTTIPALDGIAELVMPGLDSHTLSDIEYAIIEAQFGVAENGAVWITEQTAGYRVLPIICQHLIVVLNAKDIVSTMHSAYDKIGNSTFGYGAFIAGPSKTADIEQSLVLGAHGPRSMTILLML